jgi:hypothetical protein
MPQIDRMKTMSNETASENSNVVSLADYQKSDAPAPRKKI